MCAQRYPRSSSSLGRKRHGLDDFWGFWWNCSAQMQPEEGSLLVKTKEYRANTRRLGHFSTIEDFYRCGRTCRPSTPPWLLLTHTHVQTLLPPEAAE